MYAMSNPALSAEDAEAFRTRCHEFLKEHAHPGAYRDLAAVKVFQQALAEAGLAGLTYPAEYGGGGLTQEHEKIWREVAQQYPNMNAELVISHGMCLPMLNDFGTHEQKAEYLADNIAGRTVWCQMFSEPGAGSDVAGLQMRAERDGDTWVLNGQKVWTTLAHVSDYGIVICRTDPDVVKHAGISMFIVDLKSPGVEIRSIHQIDGGRHFNEVFFTDVHIPAENLLGELNNGWNQATAMLMYERVAIGSMGSGSISQPMYTTLLGHARANGSIDDPVVRDELMQIYAMETTKSMLALRVRAELKAGKTPGPGGSLGKLASSVIAWKFRRVAQAIAGPGSVAWEGDVDAEGGSLNRMVLNSIQLAIAGGTDEIQRNIIGDRVLGLPRDVAVDRVPFKELLKN